MSFSERGTYAIGFNGISLTDSSVGCISNGIISEKVDPLSKLLFTFISPSSNFESSREIESPNPVPPYFLEVPPSAC